LIEKKKMDYRTAGVDVEAGRAFVSKIRKSVESTYRREVIGGLGGFGGYFELPAGYSKPVLVSGTDGVGTKLKIAQAVDCHSSIGIDLVAMCVNDILTSGAEPLFFLDYLATGKLNPDQLSEVVTGIVEGCRQSGCALLGGETAEMPGFYKPNEYDVAGFAVGIVEREKLLDGSQVSIGDIVIGLASSGLHSNGYSLVRKIVEQHNLDWNEKIFDELSLSQICLSPTRIYVKEVLGALRAGLEIQAMSHITGGGLPENLPRCLNKGQSIRLDTNTWTPDPIFDFLAHKGNISRLEMFNTFNMGIGYALIITPANVEEILDWFRSRNIPSYAIGEVTEGNGQLVYSPST